MYAVYSMNLVQQFNYRGQVFSPFKAKHLHHQTANGVFIVLLIIVLWVITSGNLGAVSI